MERGHADTRPSDPDMSGEQGTRASPSALGASGSDLGTSAQPLPEVTSAALQTGLVAWSRRVVRMALLALITGAMSCAWFIGSVFTVGSARRRRAWRKRVFQGWSRTA